MLAKEKFLEILPDSSWKLRSSECLKLLETKKKLFTLFLEKYLTFAVVILDLLP